VPISDDEIRALARLARIAMEEDDIPGHRLRINALLDRFEALARVDIAGVEATSHCIPVLSVTRDDDVAPSLPRDDALRGAPAARDGSFIVPRILAD
jgi:aspartyl-tRNA(Asn)/glutamyl-tRNA(Gln) amidotransferase subunit C